MFCNFCKRTNHSTQNCLHRIRRFGLENKRFKKSFRNGKLLCLETWKSTSDKERNNTPVLQETEITEPTKKTNVIINDIAKLQIQNPAKTNLNLAEPKQITPLTNLDKTTTVEEENSRKFPILQKEVFKTPENKSISSIVRRLEKQNDILVKENDFLKRENLALSILYFTGSKNTTFFDNYKTSVLLEKRREKYCKDNTSIKIN